MTMSDHHDHPLPPPEEDKVDIGGVTVWGLVSFIAVIAVIMGLGGYFWNSVEELNAKRSENSPYKQMRAAKKPKANEQLKGIDASFKKVIANSAQPFPKPEPKVVAAPAAPAVKPAPFKVNAKLAAQGKKLFASKTCSACHSIDGSRLVGPTMKGIWARQEKMTDGTVLYVDEAYFTRSIKEPNAQVVEGYPAAMPALPVSDEEIKALLHYVASIK